MVAERQKPLIALNADFKRGIDSTPSVLFTFTGYYESVIKAGGTPIILPPCNNISDLDPVLDMVDGMIMIGGGDIDPRRDGFMLHRSLRLMDEQRETFDRALIKKIKKRRLPLFAIGAGMQLLNVVCGGTLFLHIQEDFSKALPHYDYNDIYHRHALYVEKKSLFYRVYGENEIKVNSQHHMAIDDVAPGFMVAARCPDSIIEGIESTDDSWFTFGTQFHPESISATAMDLRFFKEFMAGIIKRSDRFSDACKKHVQEMEAALSARKGIVRKRKKTTPVFTEEEAIFNSFRTARISINADGIPDADIQDHDVGINTNINNDINVNIGIDTDTDTNTNE